MKEIDPARPGLGKSLLGSTGAWGCERQAWYREHVRDPEGRRLRFPMPERVMFGKAVDIAHAKLTLAHLHDPAIPPADLDWSEAARAGVEVAWADAWKEEDRAEDPEGTSFRIRVTTAIEKLVGLLPNRGPRDEPELPGPPLLWIDALAQEYGAGIEVQGRNGESLSVPGVFGDRPLTLTPDYLLVDYPFPGKDDVFYQGWLDVKTLDKAYSYPYAWTKPEALVYDAGLTILNGGIRPAVHAYLEYRRNAKPYWHLEQRRVTGGSYELARLLIGRWQGALEAGDPDLLDFETGACASCDYAREVVIDGWSLHPGCPIGLAVSEITKEDGDGSADDGGD